ncbi:pilin [Xanthomonas translucens]|uniref:pilin n=1 Tax=Xanthomonas campestris pv. translucens TaxID=343 RepID=UPI0009BF3B0C|nr:pilin [Xanthomonas translucens]
MHAKGFTLIEMMIVLAIIAVLTAIAIPIYQNFVAKSQLTTALAEIEPGRSMIEVAFADAVDPSLVTASYIGLSPPTKRCASIVVSLNLDGSATLSCEVVGGSLVNGRTLSLQRAMSGAWECNASAFDARYRPAGCD